MSDEVRTNTQTPAAGDKAVRVQLVPIAGTTAGNAVDTELPDATALTDGTTVPTTPLVGALLMVRAGGNGSGANPLQTVVSLGDGHNGSWTPSVSPQMFVGGSGVYDKQRTPNVFKSFASTAITAGTGATIWTPAAGKKFRVMGIDISTSVAGQLILGDNAAGTVIARSSTLAAGGAWQFGAADFGNGILSGAADRVLKIDGPTGNVLGMVWGTEE